jgi:hypothetical protein
VTLNFPLYRLAHRFVFESGETLHGDTFHKHFGGKGANQAVQAAMLGSNVSMIARVGKDSFGSSVKANLANAGINTRSVISDDSAATGIAQIAVDHKGNNSIVVVKGANDKLRCVCVSEILVTQCKFFCLELQCRRSEQSQQDHRCRQGCGHSTRGSNPNHLACSEACQAGFCHHHPESCTGCFELAC